VTTDRQDGADWIVSSGLANGDKVIVSGLQRAQPGQPAKATPLPPANAAAKPTAAPATQG
jgi:membrane fusion protein (multidrug efflux system)